jgi:hypothetical protein
MRRSSSTKWQLTAADTDPVALKLARRFHTDYRYHVYCAAVNSTRAAQLAETFPLLMYEIYCIYVGNPLRKKAARMVEAGAPLKRVAEFMRIPMVLRRVPPGAVLSTDIISWICERNPRLFEAYMPKTLPQARLWLRAIEIAHPSLDDDGYGWYHEYQDEDGLCQETVEVEDDICQEFVEWTARHCLEIPGNRDVVLATLNDIADWAYAEETRLGLPWNHDSVRMLCPSMSVQTVMQLSDEWHEKVANARDGADYQFPPPWCAAGQVGDYEIVPITSNRDLYREGRALHHCVATYAGRVSSGGSYFYSVRKQGERVATVELYRSFDSDKRLAVRQMRGPCNAAVSKDVARAVRAWLKESQAQKVMT